MILRYNVYVLYIDIDRISGTYLAVNSACSLRWHKFIFMDRQFDSRWAMWKRYYFAAHVHRDPGGIEAMFAMFAKILYVLPVGGRAGMPPVLAAGDRCSGAAQNTYSWFRYACIEISLYT